MAKVSEGAKVQVVKRDTTTEDTKQNRYFMHFGDLYGEVQKIYGSEASVQIDLDSLTEEGLERHRASEKRMHEKWLSGLSEEAKTKLIPQELEFHLNYTILVQLDDLKVIKEGSYPAAKPVPKAVSEPKKAASKKSSVAEEATARKTLEDIASEEEAYLLARRVKPTG